MKRASSYLLSTLLLTSLCEAQEWVNFIRQHQVGTQVTWDMPVDHQGSGPSALGVEGEGALFQLWTIRKSDAKDYLLDQQLAGAYLPHAEIEIETLDPYPHVHRTRADVPFTVKLTVSDLLSGPNIPDAAKQVLAEHHLAPYKEDKKSVEVAEAIGGTPFTSGMIHSNGVTLLQEVYPQLPSPDPADPTQASGEEHFVIHALPDGDIGQTQLAHNHVEVWPVASASIAGIEPGQTVRFSTPTLSLTYEKLYPASFTYLHIYPGEPALGKTGNKVDGTKRTLDQNDTMDLVIQLKDWAGALEADGLHTMEIVTETPFGRERLAYLSFNVNRELRVNAQLHNLESGSR